MKHYHRLIPLLVLLACLGIVGGTSVFAHGSHHAPHLHTKKNPPTHTTVISDVPPPACFLTPGNVQTSSLVKCVNLAFFTPPFALSVTPDCASLTVTDSTGAAIQRNGGSWVLPMPTTGNLSFSLDGSGCPHGTYQVSVNGPGGGHFSSFSLSF